MSNNSSFSNRLFYEKSPYLLQHAHNPVNWYPWGPEAFDQARATNKPIILSVGYSTCHWCHVMAHESFENETIAQMMNDHFIAIKVDREERPDIDHIYMTAVSMMTGQGGWPLTVFLTPQGEPFYGGTYFPPFAKWGSVGFIDLLNSIAAAWQRDRDDILTSGRSITEALRSNVGIAAGEALDPKVVDQGYRQLQGQFDHTHGGFGGAPKFPMGHNLSFLLRYYKSRGEDAAALGMVEKTLTMMRHGGIWDHLGGGFHRYSTDGHWHVPHFEKMLYDQALLSMVYVEAYQETGRLDFACTAREIFDYVCRDMKLPEGGFYSAQDADSPEKPGEHSKEGAFYVFSQDEIVETLGVDAAKIFNYCYGILPEGNAASDPHGEFEGKNILYLAHDIKDAAEKFEQPPHEIDAILIKARALLLAKRQHRPALHLDDKILTDWNGLMIASLSRGSRVLGEKKYQQAATQAADFVLTQMMDKGRLLHRWRDSQAGIAATLADYAFFIYGLLEVYEASFEEKYLQAAQSLADGMIDLFGDQAGGFYMTARDAEGLIVRCKEVYDGALPSGNSVAALVLLRLSALTQKEAYPLQLEACLRVFMAAVQRNPHAYTFFLSALEGYLQGVKEIALEGPLNDSLIDEMLKVLYKYFIPYKVVKFRASATPSSAHICYRGTCLPPVLSIRDFEKALMTKV